jgi:hypothetical protein
MNTKAAADGLAASRLIALPSLDMSNPVFPCPIRPRLFLLPDAQPQRQP